MSLQNCQISAEDQYREAQAFGDKIKCTFSSLLLSREIDVFVHGSDSWGARDYYAKSNVYVICKV